MAATHESAYCSVGHLDRGAPLFGGCNSGMTGRGRPGERSHPRRKVSICFDEVSSIKAPAPAIKKVDRIMMALFEA